MPVLLTCRCGNSYHLRDEFAGQLVKCPQCGVESRAAIQEPGPSQGNPTSAGPDSVFNRDKFLIHQKHFAISEKYYVWDDRGQVLLYVERPAHGFRNFLAIFGGIIVGVIFGVFLGGFALSTTSEVLGMILGFTAFIGGFISVFVVAILLYKKRHITFYRDDRKGESLLTVLQDKKVEIFSSTFRVVDSQGQLVARLKKHYLWDILRKRWYCYHPDGTLLCMANEDSIILSLLRRVLGDLFGILRTNFIITQGKSDRILGEFNRKFTILDRYVLDLSSDPQKSLDRRIALALGVILDTGEKR